MLPVSEKMTKIGIWGALVCGSKVQHGYSGGFRMDDIFLPRMLMRFESSASRSSPKFEVGCFGLFLSSSMRRAYPGIEYSPIST